MLNSVLGTKIGMTQLFDKNGDVVPVTVVDVKSWIVTQVKSVDKDGYNAVQLGLPRNRYRAQNYSSLWLKAKDDYFVKIKEILVADVAAFSVGQLVDFDVLAINEGDVVDVTGISRGLGFQGVVKRWGFAGGPAAHGSKFHRRPGTSGCLRTQGEIIKGKRFPGHAGARQVTVKGLTVVRIDRESGCVFIKGAVPGKSNSLVTIQK